MIGSQDHEVAEVCPAEKKKRDAAERQRRYRQSAKGQASARRALDRMILRRAARKNSRFARINRDRSLNFSGIYSGPKVGGVPRLRSLPLPTHEEALRG